MDAFSGVFDHDSLLEALAIVLKMGIAVVLGGLIGWERERVGRPAGLRTHIMIAVGVVMICEVSRHFGGSDPSRIAAGIVTGIGFLGAGTILRMGVEVRGLTTAASVWATAGIAMAVSTGGFMIPVATCATILSLVTLSLLDRFERAIFPSSHSPELCLVLDRAESLADALGVLQGKGLEVRSAWIVRGPEGLEVRINVSRRSDGVVESLISTPGVVSAAWR